MALAVLDARHNIARVSADVWDAAKSAHNAVHVETVPSVLMPSVQWRQEHGGQVVLPPYPHLFHGLFHAPTLPRKRVTPCTCGLVVFFLFISGFGIQ